MKEINWIKKAFILGTVFFIAVLLVKPIGVSTQFSVLSGIFHSALDETVITENQNRSTGYENKNAYYNRSDGKLAKAIQNPWNYDFVFVLAIPAGTFLAYALNDKRRSHTQSKSGIFSTLSSLLSWRLYYFRRMYKRSYDERYYAGKRQWLYCRCNSTCNLAWQTNERRTNKMKIVLAIILGILFGTALYWIGASSPRKLISMLRLDDLTLMKIILFAIGLSSIFLSVAYFLGFFNLNHLSVKNTNLGVFIGGLLFGIGFGTVGTCPGTCVAASGSGGYKKAFSAVIGGLVGAWIFSITYHFWKV